MKKAILLAILLTVVVLQTQAQLFTFTFSGTGSCPTQGNSVNNPNNATVSSFGRVGISCYTTDNYFNSTSFSTAGSIDMSQYMEVTITPNSGYLLNLTSLSFAALRSSTGPANSRIACNASGNFTSTYYDFSAPSSSAGTISWTFGTPIISASSITFRIYGWAATSSGGTLRIGNFAVNGSITPNSLLYNDFINNRVGIGTTSPSALLHLYGTDPQLKIEASANNAAFIMYSGGGYFNYAQFFAGNVFKREIGWSDPSNTFYITRTQGQGNTNSDFVITGNGNVGIGTTNPGTYKLAVEGTIGARKVRVTQAPWADYVFKPNYNLRTLTEVEQYIKMHQHLPDVPSEKEVKSKGIDVGETQAMLLRKIEELTLYVIEQQKKIEALEKEIAKDKHSKK
ncbi:MAG: hypothetical protein JST29_01475 [Bacteroidetes bacterium]|nr:hypothetical protein [Bacteroidota bacterium]